MTHFERARMVYENEPCARSFYEDLLLHLNHGFVFSEPDAFIMGRPVDKDAPIEAIRNPEVTFSNANCWWIYLASGKGLTLFLRHEPMALPYFGFERSNKPRFHRRDQLIKHARANLWRDGVLQGWKPAESPTATKAHSAGNCVGIICQI